MRIGNTRKNKVKAIALLLCFIDGFRSREIVASLVGTIGYLSNQHAFCFPFLNRANHFALGSSISVDSDLVNDLVLALVIASTPWSPECDVRWEYPDLPRERWIFVDAQNDFARFGIIWCHSGVWLEASVSIPPIFSGTQQSAELFALWKALAFGINFFGDEFVLVSDSVGSIHALHRPNMGSHSDVRNYLLRSIVSQLLGRRCRIRCLWVPSEFNPADGGSRLVLEEGRLERVYGGEMEEVFEVGCCLDRADFYSRTGPCDTDGRFD